MRDVVSQTTYPLPLPSALSARSRTRALLAELEDYALPRLTYLAAPLLVVVGGSTGAGKSTLVNSLVQAPVSVTGVLRPTTREPVLVCHPSDTPWFRGDRRLAGLTRRAARTPTPTRVRDSEPPPLRLLAAPALPPGLAFLDSPDLDSIEAGNRALARRLFTTGDLWLFVTTPQRYADALPWHLLHTARERRATAAVVLSRVAPAAAPELLQLLSELLAANGLADLPVFAIPETKLDRQGLLPEPALASLRGWFDALAANADARYQMVRSTLDGALAALPEQLTELATAAEEQVAAAIELAEQVGLAYGLARGTVDRAVAAANGASTADQGQPTQDRSGLAAVVCSAVADADEQVDTAWRAHPAGAALLAGEPSATTPDLLPQVRQILDQHQTEQLPARLADLLDRQASRWLERLADVSPAAGPERRLRAVAANLQQARQDAALAGDDPSPPNPTPPESAREGGQ